MHAHRGQLHSHPSNSSEHPRADGTAGTVTSPPSHPAAGHPHLSQVVFRSCLSPRRNRSAFRTRGASRKNRQSVGISLVAGPWQTYDNKVTEQRRVSDPFGELGHDRQSASVRLSAARASQHPGTPLIPCPGPADGWNRPRVRHPAAPGSRPEAAIVRNKANLPGPGSEPSYGRKKSYSDSNPDGARRNKPNFCRRRAWDSRRPANQRTPGGRGRNRVPDQQNTPRIRSMCMGRDFSFIHPPPEATLGLFALILCVFVVRS